MAHDDPACAVPPAVHGTYFCRGGSQTRPSHLHPWAPVYLFHGDVSPLRRRVTFATAQKSPKSRSGGGVFRFPPPPENPYPTPTNLVLVSSRSLVSPERARLAPSATRPLPMEIACAGFPLGSRFGPPIGCTPRGSPTVTLFAPSAYSVTPPVLRRRGGTAMEEDRTAAPHSGVHRRRRRKKWG